MGPGESRLHVIEGRRGGGGGKAKGYVRCWVKGTMFSEKYGASVF